ncbi:MAG: DUF975 family protein, partial [Clostridia bacterium]|nr:DUF975 family protein [Clostridia bacterium]
MKTRKEMKQGARKSLKKHYAMFVAVCIIAAFFGSEFSSSLNVVTIPSNEEQSADVVPAGEENTEITMSQVIAEALLGDEAGSRELSEELKEEAVENTKEGKGSAALGRSRGVLAGVVNTVASGSIFVTLISAVNSMFGSNDITVFIFVLLSAVFAFLIWFLLYNVYAVISRRIFLEGRTYEKISIQRFAFLLRVKKWLKACCTMFLQFVLYALWCCTIVGAAVKRYSYYMVPYITAENPDISPVKVITLSRKMMKGHKWECFVFELSYLGWEILNVVTFGLSGIFYSNPYKIAAFSEYYAQIRSQAIDNKIDGYELLNDRYLFEKASEEVIDEAYKDALEEIEKNKNEAPEPLKGFTGLLANVFGITILNRKDEKVYEEYQSRKLRYEVIKNAVNGHVYPGRLFPIPMEKKKKRVETLRYVRRYSVWSLIMLFLAFSFIGWVWEVSLHLVSDGEFVNRGVLHGPWLPIYGTGGIMILVVLNKLRGYPVFEFI